MEYLNQILSRTRNLARVQGLDLDSATQQAIDELSEAQTVPLDEIELAQRARLELEGLGVLQPLLANFDLRRRSWSITSVEALKSGAVNLVRSRREQAVENLLQAYSRLFRIDRMRLKIICPFCEVWLVELTMTQGVCEFECLGCANRTKTDNCESGEQSVFSKIGSTSLEARR